MAIAAPALPTASPSDAAALSASAPSPAVAIYPAGSRDDLDADRPAIASGKATLTLMTPGARVLLVSGDDQREVPMLPITIAFHGVKRWVIHATKAGYCEYVQVVDFDDGVAVKTYDILLRRGCGAGR